MPEGKLGGLGRRQPHWEFATFTRTPFKLDAQGWTELAQASKRWLEEAADIEYAAAQRLEADPHSAVNVGLVVLLFEALAFSASEAPKRAPAARSADDRKQGRRGSKAAVQD